jgi:integrin alpha FG-GAP repeat containing protein 1
MPTRYQIWLNEKQQGYRLAQDFALPINSGPISFADMGMFLCECLFIIILDGDGAVDMVFYACPDECFLHIAYNQQMPLCSASSNSGGRCRKAHELCSRDAQFRFDLTTINEVY